MSDKAFPNKRLKRQRELNGWTRSYVAGKIESDPQTVARWERGATFPSPYYRQKLCELFGKNAAELGLIKDDPHDDNGHYADQSSFHPGLTSSEALQPEPIQDTRYKYRSTTRMPVSLRLRLFLHRNHLTRRLVILGLVVLIGALILPGKYVTIWISNGVQFGRGTNITVTVRIIPGGLWISPTDGQTIKDIISFAAHAYPTNPSDPPIDHVNFTARWNGGWRIACTVHPNRIDDTFRCNASLKQLEAPAGRIQVSFDVYDKMNDVNKAPNGVRTIIYPPL